MGYEIITNRWVRRRGPTADANRGLLRRPSRAVLTRLILGDDYAEMPDVIVRAIVSDAAALGEDFVELNPHVSRITSMTSELMNLEGTVLRYDT